MYRYVNRLSCGSPLHIGVLSGGGSVVAGGLMRDPDTEALALAGSRSASASVFADEDEDGTAVAFGFEVELAYLAGLAAIAVVDVAECFTFAPPRSLARRRPCDDCLADALELKLAMRLGLILMLGLELMPEP